MQPDRELLIDEIVQAQRVVFQAIQAMAPSPWLQLDLTMAQLKGLFLLANHGPMTVGHLAQALAVGKPAASILADRLVQLGLVERAEDPHDRRRTFVRLSASGEDLVIRLRQGSCERLRAWLGQLSAGDLAALRQGLYALAAVVTADRSQQPLLAKS